MAVTSHVPRPTAFPRSADRSAVSTRADVAFIRAIAATGVAELTDSTTARVLAERWPGDGLAPIIAKAARTEHKETRDGLYLTRASVVPASTSGVASASLVGLGLTDLAALAGPSASSAILSQCLQADFGRQGVVMVPKITIGPGSTSFVLEAAPIPARSFAFDANTIVPHKLATLVAFNRELFEHSTPTIELTVRQILAEGISYDLDSYMFDGLAGNATRPGSLIEGILPTGVSAATDPNENMTADLISLLTTVGVIGGQIIVAASPRQAARARLRRDLTGGVEVVASSALALRFGCGGFGERNHRGFRFRTEVRSQSRHRLSRRIEPDRIGERRFAEYHRQVQFTVRIKATKFRSA